MEDDKPADAAEQLENEAVGETVNGVVLRAEDVCAVSTAEGNVELQLSLVGRERLQNASGD